LRNNYSHGKENLKKKKEKSAKEPMMDAMPSNIFKNAHISIHDKSCKDLCCCEVAAFM